MQKLLEEKYIFQDRNFVNSNTHLHLVTNLSILNDHTDESMFCLKFFSNILISR